MYSERDIFHKSLGTVENQWPKAKICSRDICGVVGCSFPKPKGKRSQNTLLLLNSALASGAPTACHNEASEFLTILVPEHNEVCSGGTRPWEN